MQKRLRDQRKEERGQGLRQTKLEAKRSKEKQREKRRREKRRGGEKRNEERKIKASPNCGHCGQPEAIKHAILSCSQYDSARSDLFAALRFRLPDDYLMEICLGRTPDEKHKGLILRPMSALRPRSSSRLTAFVRIFDASQFAQHISFDLSPHLLSSVSGCMHFVLSSLAKKSKRTQGRKEQQQKTFSLCGLLHLRLRPRSVSVFLSCCFQTWYPCLNRTTKRRSSLRKKPYFDGSFKN